MGVAQIVPQVHAVLVWPTSTDQLSVNVQVLLRSEDTIPVGVHNQVTVLGGVSELGKVGPHADHTATGHNRLIGREQWWGKARDREQVENVISVGGSLHFARNQQKVTDQVQGSHEAELVVVDRVRLALRVHPGGGVNAPVEHGVGQVCGPLLAHVRIQLSSVPVEVRDGVRDLPGGCAALGDVPLEGHQDLGVSVDLIEDSSVQRQLTDHDQRLGTGVSGDVRNVVEATRLHDVQGMAGEEDFIARRVWGVLTRNEWDWGRSTDNGLEMEVGMR